MITYANQRTCEIIKTPCDNNKPFLMINRDTLEDACKNLPNGAFKVYIYFVSNKPGFKMGISPQDIAEKCGISEDTARTAIKTLISKGYLVQSGAKNNYKFSDRLPDKEERRKMVIEGKEYTTTYEVLLDACGGNTFEAKIYWNEGEIVK